MSKADPKKYAEYDAAMKGGDSSHPMAVEWQNANREAIAKATTDGALAEILTSPAKTKALLAEVKAAYESDPLKMTQIAAMTQFVMRPEAQFSERRLWVQALRYAFENAPDEYRRAIYRDQLEWCS